MQLLFLQDVGSQGGKQQLSAKCPQWVESGHYQRYAVAMRIDVRMRRSMWRQTAWVTALVMACVAAMIAYALTSAAPDYSVGFLLVLLFAMSLMLGVAYLIKRFIGGLAD